LREGAGQPHVVILRAKRVVCTGTIDFMRRVLLVLSVVSLAASIMLGVMWVESYSASDVWSIRWGKQKNGGILVDFAGVISSRGVLKCNISDMMAGAADTAYLNFYCGHRRFRFAIPGFGSQFSYLAQSKGTGASFTASTQVNFPYWVAVGGLAMPALVYLAIWKRRKKSGCCAVCGYDLRASPERCPECGTATPVRLSGGLGSPGSRGL
jgi:hypothetical protein